MKKARNSAPVTSPKFRCTTALAALATIISVPALHAASGTWNLDNAGNWGTAANWTPAAIPGTAAGDVISLTNNISAARTVTIDTTSRTAGDLNIGDSTAGLFGFTLASSGAAVVLNLDGTGTTDATVDFTAGVANTISAPLTLVDNAIFRSNVAFVQTLSGIISGAAKTVTFNNDTDGVVNAAAASNGQFLVTGNNTYSGGTTISDVRVNITTNNTALGAAGSAVNIQNGGQMFASTGLATINYAFNIAGDGWVETAAGQPFGALRLEGGAVVTGNVALSANASVGGNGTGTINGVVSGAGFTLGKRGTGTIILGGANTYSGGTTIGNGALQLNNNNAAGTGAISLIAGGATNATKLLVNGGVTVGNNINIGAVFGVAGQGALQQTGTGLATLNGAINITGSTTAGGHLVGGGAATNALVLNGAITSTVQVTQRDGFVRYSGGGTGYTSLAVTGTALLGATNGIATSAGVNVGVSNFGTLDLNGFNQTITSLSLGNFNANSPITGSLALGASTLNLNGDLSIVSTGTGNAVNTITASNSGGTVNFGASPRNLSVADNSAPDDIVISTATIAGAGVTKTGTGTLALNGATVSAPLTVSTGTLQIGTATSVGSATIGSVNFASGTTLRMKAGASNDALTVSNAGGFVNAGTTNLIVNQLGGILANGTYPLINYTGASPGTGTFNLIVGHAAATLSDTAGVISLSVTGNDRVIWDGTNSTAWSTGATGNWKLQSSPITPADFIESDDVIFQDTPTNSNVVIAANVSPSNVSFTNTVATTYNVTGTAGIVGTTGLTKTGNGTVVLATPNSYGGATTVSAGTLELDHDATGNVVLSGTSGVSVAGGATLRLTRDDGNFTFNRNLSGAGTVVIDPHTAAGAAVRDVVISGNNTGFSGLWKLSPSNVGAAGLGSFRTNTPVTATNLGSAAVDVDNGGQLWFTGTIANNVTITGTGYAETGGGTPVSLAAATTGGVYLGAGTAPFTYGGIGAIRMDSATLTGNVTVDGTAKIGANNTIGIISGNISAVGGSDLLVIGGGTAANSITATGAISVPRVLVNGGATAGSQTLQIGNNGTAGTISSPEIILYGSAAANGVLRLNRTDGLTFTNQSILGGAAISADLARTFFLVNTTGAGVTLTNTTLDLSDGAIGGTIRVGDTAGITGSVLNIGGTSTVDVGFITLSELAGVSGTVNQSGTSSVSFLTTLRVGHFGTNTSNYNISGGTLSTPTAAPGTFPYTTAATEQNGGIYVGIDGTGNLTQSGGTITTNFLVLDNRGDTSVGTNMATGIDTFQQNGGTLVLKSAHGLITRNLSTAVNLNGGTIQALAANPALDTNKLNVQAGGATFDTNGANTFTLYGPLSGVGAVALTNTAAGNGVFSVVDGGAGANITAGGTMPGGVINTAVSIASNTTLQGNRTVSSTWSGALSGAGTLTKLNTGSLTLAGSGAGFTGTVNASAGRLDLPNDLAATTVNVADGATLSGEPTVTNLNLGTTTGSTVLFNPNTAGGLTATNLALNGTTTLDFASVPTPGAPWRAILYTNKSGVGTVALANAASYRVAPVIDDDGSRIAVTVTGTKALTWKGTASAIWDNGATVNNNWDAGSGAENFFAGDTVRFDGNTPLSVTVTSGVSPWKTTVDTVADNYTFNTTGAGIAGPGSLEKLGASTLTLAGPNTYSGQTVISGGTVAIAAPTSLGNSAATNTIALSGGGRLSYTAATAADLGPNRSIIVGTGGGSISHNNATAAAITIPGKLTGSGTNNLSFHSAAAGAGTFILTGDNSGFTGKISVDAPAAAAGGLTTLRIANQSSAPTGGSITLNYPAAATTTGNAVTLDLPGTSLPAAVALNMTAFLNGAISQRTQVTSSSIASIDGPIALTGNAGSVVQFSPANGSLTINGNIAESSPGSFGVSGTTSTIGVVFFRNAGQTVVNGTINLPTAMVVRVDDGGPTVINSTGNVWALSDVRSNGTLRIGASNALAIAAPLRIGQASDAGTSIFELNGFNQEVAGLDYINGNGANTRRVTNSGTTLSTLTINNVPSPAIGNATGDYTFGSVATNGAGNLTGNLAIVKNGAGTQTFAGPANTYTGNVTVNGGTLVAGGNQGSTALGSPTTAGRTVTVNNSGMILSFTTNNVFGNGVGNANLPATTLNAGTTLTSTRYNVLGPITLNGATLTQSATDAGSYEGYQFRGTVTVGGSAASTISTGNGKANHLNANTTFAVDNATGDAASDLIVSAPLRNQSGDFALAAGALTKSGFGKMELTAVNTFTGGVTVDQGVLAVNSDAALGAAAGPVAINNNAILQATGPVTTTARTVTFGFSGAVIDTNGNDVTYGAGSTLTGSVLTKIGTGKFVIAGTQTYGILDTEAGRTDLASRLGTGSSAIIANADVNISVDQTLASLTIGDGATVTLGSPLPPAPGGAGAALNPSGEIDGLGAASAFAAPGSQAVPEPGIASLLAFGALGLFGRRRMRKS